MTELQRNYINGRWIPADGVTENRSPADPEDLIGLCARGSAADVADAVAAAKAAQPAGGKASPQLRSDMLRRAGDLLLARVDDMGRLLAREEGKTLAEARGEALRAAQLFHFHAGEALRHPGEKLASLRDGVEAEVTRESLGVVGLVTPWSFPIAIPAWKTAPALAAGNAVVLKPADLTPGSRIAWRRFWKRQDARRGSSILSWGAGPRSGRRSSRTPMWQRSRSRAPKGSGAALRWTARAA